MTQPAHPVQSPEVMTSSKSSFHWSCQRSLLPADSAYGPSSTVSDNVMARL